jgi:DNA-directed RNA polymerase subunit alpha
MKYTLTIECDSLAEFNTLLNTQNIPLPTSTTRATVFDGIPEHDRITSLPLMVRTENCLKAEGILRISTLLKWNAEALLRIPNFGRKSLNDVKECLVEKGLALNSDLTYQNTPFRDEQP